MNIIKAIDSIPDDVRRGVASIHEAFEHLLESFHSTTAKIPDETKQALAGHLHTTVSTSLFPPYVQPVSVVDLNGANAALLKPAATPSGLAIGTVTGPSGTTGTPDATVTKLPAPVVPTKLPGAGPAVNTGGGEQAAPATGK